MIRPYRAVENQRVYLIENEQGTPLMHVAAGPGIDLASFINQKVELWGSVAYEPKLRTNLLTAVQVQKVP